ncbi:MAG: PD-(D/E)XK nuclease family protein [Methanospirillum sp.]|jgi:S-DNA-T family DNA segregation ATPase FtsK/SpoIIIE|nr:PD-(D/E)XK nuclease family protein [Methanospirillum sp.]
MQRLFVSELHLCQHCPRLFGYACRGEKDAWRVGQKGSGNLPGKRFHTFADQVFRHITQEKTSQHAFITALQSPDPDSAESIREFIKNEFFIPYLTKHAPRLSHEQIEAFAVACDRWIRYLRVFISPDGTGIEDPKKLISTIFHSSEYTMSSDFLCDDGEVVKISGRPDALLFDPGTHEPVVVEYKGRKESDPTQDLAQTSLYAWLVSRSIGITPRVDMLYLEEPVPLVRYDSSTIQTLIENHASLITLARRIKEGHLPVPRCKDPALCTICPYASCDTDFFVNRPDTSHKEEEERPTDTRIHNDPSQAEAYLSKLVETLRLLSIPVLPAGYTIGPRFIRLKIIPDLSKRVTFSKIANRAVDIQLGLSLTFPPLIQAQSGYISCDVPHDTWQPCDVRSLIRDGKPSSRSLCPFPIGRRIDGSVMMGDLADPVMTSCLIGGTSGSGKSELIRSIVIGSTLMNPKNQVSFILIDPKRVTFTDFLSFPSLFMPVIMDPDMAITTLDACVREMEERYIHLEKTGFTNISEYNTRQPEPMTRRIIVIDEYADLIMNRVTKEALETAIQKIGQKGRAAGFHLILATQRPDARIITGVIKANLQLKIGLKVTSASNSRIILDESGAECLAGYGDMLIGGSVPIQRLQGALVSSGDFSACGKK